MDCKKTKFATEAYALAYIKKLKQTSVRKVVPQETYLCPQCNTWHLTSRQANKSEITKLNEALHACRKKDKERINQIKLLEDNIRKYKQRIQSLKSELYSIKQMKYDFTGQIREYPHHSIEGYTNHSPVHPPSLFEVLSKCKNEQE